MSNCEIPGCSKKLKSRLSKYCSMHYERNRVHGNLEIRFPNRVTGGCCSIEDCSNTVIAKTLCVVHYARKLRHGDTDSRLPTYGTGRVIHEQGYIRIRVWENGKYKFKFEHVILAEEALGKPLPPGVVIHHMNEDPADNTTPLNLVICPNQSYHMLLHRRLEYYKKTGNIPGPDYG